MLDATAPIADLISLPILMVRPLSRTRVREFLAIACDRDDVPSAAVDAFLDGGRHSEGAEVIDPAPGWGYIRDDVWCMWTRRGCRVLVLSSPRGEFILPGGKVGGRIFVSQEPDPSRPSREA